MSNTVYYRGGVGDSASLAVFDRNGFQGVFPLLVRNTLGRKNCEIVMQSPIVSRMHGEIFWAMDRYWYVDMNSTNGTLLNGNWVEPCRRVPLETGDILQFDAPQPNGRHPYWMCAVFSGESFSRKWEMMELRQDMTEIRVGRSPDSDLRIDDERISQDHCLLLCSDEGWAAMDRESTNGVFLNGNRLDRLRYMNPGDVLRMADSYFVYLGDRLLYSLNRDEGRF